MKLTIIYEQKRYITEMKQVFTTEDIISNMRRELGDKENQNYILCDKFGNHIKPKHYFYPNDKDITLILMEIPSFNTEEPLYDDNIKINISELSEDPKTIFDMLVKIPANHGNPEKLRESSQEIIGNIYGSFNNLPDLVKESKKKYSV